MNSIHVYNIFLFDRRVLVPFFRSTGCLYDPDGIELMFCDSEPEFVIFVDLPYDYFARYFDSEYSVIDNDLDKFKKITKEAEESRELELQFCSLTEEQRESIVGAIPEYDPNEEPLEFFSNLDLITKRQLLQ